MIGLNLTTLNSLLGPTGVSALAAASASDPTEAKYLVALAGLRKKFPAELSRAAIDTVLLRQKAAVKFTRAASMYFSKEALEVSSGEVIARYRAERFARFDCVGDFGCGIGGDAIGLATANRTVVAIDSDPVRLRMAEENLKVYGHAGNFIAADLLTEPLPLVPAAFADPGRRSEGKRFLSLADYAPPPGELIARLPKNFPIGFKLAPGASWEDLGLFPGEVEFISVDGELKESVLWLGELRTTARRATLLTSAGTRRTMEAETVDERRDQVEIGAYLYDPEAAVNRAGLVPNLASRIDASPIDAVVQLLTSDGHRETPFAAVYRVEAVLPLDAKKISAWLRSNDIGRITAVKRGSLADTDELQSKWKLSGSKHRFVLFTRAASQQVAIVAERV